MQELKITIKKNDTPSVNFKKNWNATYFITDDLGNTFEFAPNTWIPMIINAFKKVRKEM